MLSSGDCGNEKKVSPFAVISSMSRLVGILGDVQKIIVKDVPMFMAGSAIIFHAGESPFSAAAYGFGMWLVWKGMLNLLLTFGIALYLKRRFEKAFSREDAQDFEKSLDNFLEMFKEKSEKPEGFQGFKDVNPFLHPYKGTWH